MLYSDDIVKVWVPVLNNLYNTYYVVMNHLHFPAPGLIAYRLSYAIDHVTIE